jgi:hypothetical protein
MVSLARKEDLAEEAIHPMNSVSRTLKCAAVNAR